MFSTPDGRRKLLVGCAAMAVSAMSMVGCQRIIPQTAVKLNSTPLIVDDAMQKRDWDKSVCYYGNGDTVAGGTGYMFQTHETIPEDWRRLTDVPVATMNALLLPVGIFVNNAFVNNQVYQGDIVPESYTTQPPLP